MGMMVNIFFHLCARNWSLGTLVFHVVTGTLELAATILAILYYVADGQDEKIGASTIVMYVAGGLSFTRLLFAFITCCVRRAAIKEEDGSSWDLFWPCFEMLLSAGSTLALIILAFVMRQCLPDATP